MLRWLSQGFDLTLCDASLAALSSKIVLRKNNYSYNKSNINYNNSCNNNVINYNNYSNNIYNSLSAKCRAQSFDFRRVQKKEEKIIDMSVSRRLSSPPPPFEYLRTCLEHVCVDKLPAGWGNGNTESEREGGRERGRPTKPKEGSHFNIIRQQQQHRWAISRRGEGAEEWRREREEGREREAESRREKQREGESSRKRDMQGKRDRESMNEKKLPYWVNLKGKTVLDLFGTHKSNRSLKKGKESWRRKYKEVKRKNKRT